MREKKSFTLGTPIVGHPVFLDIIDFVKPVSTVRELKIQEQISYKMKVWLVLPLLSTYMVSSN